MNGKLAVHADPATRRVAFEAFHRDDHDATPDHRDIPVEAAVALEFNGIAYAVMMATPTDLEDFMVGFAVGEGLLRPEETLTGIVIHETELGTIVRANLSGPAVDTVFARARTRVVESSCGICGMESLEALHTRPEPVPRPLALAPAAIFRALDALRPAQTLGRKTAATHAAALVEPAGALCLVREDVGRHNAVDKAIGARTRAAQRQDCFMLSTARCSYELVEKTVMAKLGAIVTISAPTTLAVARARAAGLPLYALARANQVLRLA